MPNYLAPDNNLVNLLAARMNPNIAAQGLRGRQNMAAPESVMDPRYAAWKKSQEDAELLGLMSDMALSAVPLAGPAARGAMAAGRSLAPTAGRMTENYMLRSGMMLPLDTWHGTPHRFPPTAKNPLGEFDPMKVGTGEGAQSYGVGAGYLAENRTTGQTYNPNPGIASAAWDKSMKYWTDKLARNDNPVVAAKEIAILKEKMANQTGYLYKVDLPDEQIAKMLDWDKPLSQQVDLGQKISPESLGLTYKQLENGNHAFVNSEGKILGNLQKNGSKESFTKNWIENVLQGSGRDLYNQLGQGMGGGAKVSEALRQAGIPGIRYLDQGSRAGGKGTSNFVVFDPKHMNIIGRE